MYHRRWLSPTGKGLGNDAMMIMALGPLCIGTVQKQRQQEKGIVPPASVTFTSLYNTRSVFIIINTVTFFLVGESYRLWYCGIGGVDVVVSLLMAVVAL